MWQTICTNNGMFMFNIEEKEEEIIFQLSNLKEIWTDNVPKEKVIEIFQDCNPNFDLKSGEIVVQVLKIFEEIDTANVDIARKDGSVDVNIVSNLGEFDNLNIEIKFNFELGLAQNDELTRLITAPLIQTVYFLEKQQKMLCNLLERKDRELEEYRMEKGDISRDDLITEKFEDNVLQKGSETLLLNVFGKSEKFIENLNEEYGEIKETVVRVAVEPWNERKVKRKIYDATTAAKKRGRSKIVYLDSKK